MSSAQWVCCCAPCTSPCATFCGSINITHLCWDRGFAGDDFISCAEKQDFWLVNWGITFDLLGTYSLPAGLLRDGLFVGDDVIPAPGTTPGPQLEGTDVSCGYVLRIPGHFGTDPATGLEWNMIELGLWADADFWHYRVYALSVSGNTALAVQKLFANTHVDATPNIPFNGCASNLIDEDFRPYIFSEFAVSLAGRLRGSFPCCPCLSPPLASVSVHLTVDDGGTGYSIDVTLPLDPEAGCTYGGIGGGESTSGSVAVGGDNVFYDIFINGLGEIDTDGVVHYECGYYIGLGLATESGSYNCTYILVKNGNDPRGNYRDNGETSCVGPGIANVLTATVS